MGFTGEYDLGTRFWMMGYPHKPPQTVEPDAGTFAKGRDMAQQKSSARHLSTCTARTGLESLCTGSSQLPTFVSGRPWYAFVVSFGIWMSRTLGLTIYSRCFGAKCELIVFEQMSTYPRDPPIATSSFSLAKLGIAFGAFPNTKTSRK